MKLLWGGMHPTDFTFTQPDLPIDASALLDRATTTDGFAALSEQFLLGLTDPRLDHTHRAAYYAGELVALAASDGTTVELVVHPAYRRHHLGSRLLAELGGEESGGPAPASSPQPVWAHGNVPAAQAFATALGMRKQRRLLVLRLSEPALEQAAHDELPAGFEVWDFNRAVATFGHADLLEAFRQVNNQAFSWHPEQGGWSPERMERALEVEWFSPEGLLFLVDVKKLGAPNAAMAGSPASASDVLAGFHWTKTTGPAGSPPEQLNAEVYVVGLADAYRGQGLGGPLLAAGLAHLRSVGAQLVDLYVEDDNAPALKAYEKAGFVIHEEHVLYSAPDPERSSKYSSRVRPVVK